MPFVTISVLKGKSQEYINAVADSVNSAVIATMDFPADDRYQIIHQLDAGSLQLQNSSEDRLMMHLVMRAGRPDKAKQKFYQQVVLNLAQSPGIKPENVMITITENHDVDWSFKDGIAQFVV